MNSTEPIKKGQIEDYISDSAAVAFLEKLSRGTYTGNAQDIVNIMNAYVAGSTIINGVTPSSAIPASGNIHTYVAAAGTYTNWNSIVVPVNTLAILTRVDGVYSISQTALSLVDYVKKTDFEAVNLSKNLFNPINIMPNSYVKTSGTPGINYQTTPGWAVAYFPLTSETLTSISLSGWNTVRTEMIFYSGSIPAVFPHPISANVIAMGSAASFGITKSSGNASFIPPTGTTWFAITVMTTGETAAAYSVLQMELSTSPTTYTTFISDFNVEKIETKKLIANYLRGEVNKTVSSLEVINALRLNGINRDEVALTIKGSEISIRTPFNNDFDLVHKWENIDPITKKLNSNGVYKIAKTDYVSQGTLMHGFADNIAPFRAETLAIGGAHGVILPTVTFNAHGKTSSDLFSLWSDGTFQWYLIEIPTANSLKFYGKKYTTTNGTTIPVTIQSATLTHISGATNTANINHTSAIGTEYFPVTKNQTVKIYIDGLSVTADGTYRGKSIKMSDEKELIDIREIPLATPFVIANAPTWLFNKTVFTYNKTGYTINNLVDFRRSYYMDHYGVIQNQRMAFGTDGTTIRKIYLPNSGIVSAIDYRLPVNMANGPTNTAIFGKLTVENPEKPVQRMVELLQTTGGTSKIGLAHGYFYSKGLSKTSNRKELSEQWEIRAATGKSYPKVVSKYSSSNQVNNCVAYFNYFDPTTNPNATSVYVNDEGGYYMLYIDYHQAINKDTIVLPEYLSGKDITLVDGNGGIVINSGEQVAGRFLNATVTLVNGYAYGVFKIT